MTAKRQLSNKQVEIQCSRRRKAFFKRAVQKRYIRIRFFTVFLFFCIFFYLAALFFWKDKLFYAKEDYVVSYEKVNTKDEEELITDQYGVIVRIKKGELELYHSRESMSP